MHYYCVSTERSTRTLSPTRVQSFFFLTTLRGQRRERIESLHINKEYCMRLKIREHIRKQEDKRVSEISRESQGKSYFSRETHAQRASSLIADGMDSNKHLHHSPQVGSYLYY